MKKSIDILVINNAPSFYKVNLYNELARHCKLHVIFIALTNQVVISKSFKEDMKFSYDVLSFVQIEERNRLLSLLRLFGICNQFNYQKIIYGGYADLEEKVLMWITPTEKNCLQFESSIRESRVTGYISILKKIIFSRFAVALPSGNLQTAVFNYLKFSGNIVETKGVGLFNKPTVEKKKNIAHVNELKYLYVGRLIPIKNLELLIRVFNKTRKSLTIVGDGILKETLKLQAGSNIKFAGFVPNSEIGELYGSHDVFVLPSISEPWGLVVEEAIYFGLPVLVSEAVGCQHEMVVQPNTGIIFSPNNEESLIDAISKLEASIDGYRKNCMEFDFEKRDKEQVNAYLEILSL